MRIWVCLRGFCGQSKSGPPKGVCAGWVGRHPILRPQDDTEGRGGANLSLCKPDVPLFLPRDIGDIVALGCRALTFTLGLKGPADPSLSQASDSAGSCSLAVLGPQPAGSLWGFSVSITMDMDSYNKSLLFRGFPGASVVKGSPCQCKRPSLIPGWGRPPGGGNGHPLQYSCLENPMDRGGSWATVHGVANSRT